MEWPYCVSLVVLVTAVSIFSLVFVVIHGFIDFTQRFLILIISLLCIHRYLFFFFLSGVVCVLRMLLWVYQIISVLYLCFVLYILNLKVLHLDLLYLISSSLPNLTMTGIHGQALLKYLGAYYAWTLLHISLCVLLFRHVIPPHSIRN